MRAVSFSLYGDREIFCVGAIKNAEMMPEFYPGWQAIFCVDGTVPKSVLRDLDRLGAWLRYYDRNLVNGMLWRMLIYDEPGLDYYVSRDCDSRFTIREITAVQLWIDSGKTAHVMRDHPHHTNPMMGGMHGLCPRKLHISMHALVDAWPKDNKDGYGDDQNFLATHIWPLVKFDCMQHDAYCRDKYPGAVPWPTQRVGQEFVGERVSACGEPEAHNRTLIA